METKEVIKQYEENKAKQEHDLMMLLSKLEDDIPEEKLRACCVFVMKDMIKFAKGKIEKEYARYGELAGFNVPYQDRIEAINVNGIERWKRAISFYDRVLRNGFEVNPWRMFVFPGDEYIIKEFGLTNFIRSNLKYVIKHDEQWHQKNKQS